MIENSKVQVKVEECINCKMCMKVCPYNLYFFENEQISLSEIFEEFCIECGHCVSICPANIISLKCHDEQKWKPLPEKSSIANYDALYSLVIKRRSIRHFKKERVPKELLVKILELARYTATGHNEENLYYTIVQDPELLKKFINTITNNVQNFINKYEDPEGRKSLEAVLPKQIMEKAGELVSDFKRKLNDIASGKEVWTWDTQIIIVHSPKTAATLIENCSIAAENIMLAAESLGLATCSLGYATAMLNQFRSVSKVVKIPRNHRVGYTLSIGYPKINYLRVPARNTVQVNWL
ncbi:MAG: nitroreductase family protein [Promethearchaeota archaeon]